MMRSFDKAISELIGALILIMLVAGILGIVMTVLLSQPPPEKLPAVDFNLKIDDPFLVPGTGTASQMPKIRIFHDRGDPFKIFYDSDSDEKSSFYVVVDGIKWDVTRNREPELGTFLLVKNQEGGEYGDFFSVGDELIAPYQGQRPENVQFIYKNQKGGEFLLWETGDTRKGIVSFLYSPASPYRCERVQFTDTSSITATSWSWTFGDGTSSSERNPTHCYTTSGQKTVTLTISNGIDTWSTSRILSVRDLQADFSATPMSVATNMPVKFFDLSKGSPNQWKWSFGDGTSSPAPNPPPHIYTNPGKYTVTLQVSRASDCNPSDECESQSVSSKEIIVYECIPISGLDFDRGPFCVNVNYLIRSYYTSGSVPISFLWTFDGGSSTYSTQNVNHVFTVEGNNRITLEADTCADTPPISDEVVVYDCSCNARITAIRNGEGTISYEGEHPFSCGSSPVYIIDTDNCHYISSIVVDGTLLTDIGSYAKHYEYTGFSKISEGVYTIEVTFEEIEPSITIKTSGDGSGSINSSINGLITTPGIDHVPCGSNPVYTITAQPCNSISSIIVDGTSFTGPFESPYNYSGFPNVQEDHTIEAVFTESPLTIKTIITGNGVISPGTGPVLCGSSPIYTITAGSCNRISSILVDGIPLSGPFSNPYVYSGFANIQEDHIIEAVFTPDTFNITATAGTGGSISPSGVVPVTCGGSQTFTFTPDSGYEIDGVIVDGQSIGVVNSYTFTNIQENHTIHVDFGNTGYCLIAGYITDETTGLGVPGIKVDVWNEDRTMILRSGISQSNGYYAIKHPKPKKSYWVDVNCPDQGNWRTNNPVSRWYNNVHLNPAAYCDQTNINFSGRVYSNIVENVFIHGQRLSFAGDTIMGHGSTVIITGGLNTASTNLGAQIGATTIYIDGDVDLATGSAGLGSSTKPGNIYINGDLRLWNGQREIYGDVYVNGNFDLKDARIHGMVFVDGDLTLDWTPYLATDARIFYTGQIHHPNNYDQNILAKCIKWDTVPGFTIPDGLPSLKPDDWYSSNGYGTGGLLTSGMKVFAASYSSTGYRPSATNVIIVAKTGDITITGLGGSSLTGIFFAPYGKVTFGGGSLQGLILTRDGFFVTSGGTDVTFLPIHHYISNPSEYPFQ